VRQALQGLRLSKEKPEAEALMVVEKNQDISGYCDPVRGLNEPA
jgi:hypothetical protein